MLYFHGKRQLKVSAIFNLHLVILIALILNSATASASDCHKAQISNSPNSVWWREIRFMPCDVSILGVPVNRIHPDWTRASLLKKENIPPSGNHFQSRDDLSDSNLSFELIGDLNHDGTLEIAVTGVYETSNGIQGHFVGIFTRSKMEEWHLMYLYTDTSPNGIWALRESVGGIELWNCLACDEPSLITWNNNSKEYEIK